ncbi:sulfite exporter TauE/SafE family protein [Actinomadura rayongensis]|uniref:Urease accessory protein UreH-like transmembrane domain-containing protein n=1 Tax=Actinomadura rayongensis TaxID=1429076 RepID=A0A6I4WKD3_9ACTN|nr:sulfite exporter TauE/SafE family protein [Actinomadura rayongensis]MXQ68146.1 hypothetical protein [Actinomadura rayongensis]
MDATALFVAGAGGGLLAGATSCAAVQLGLLAGALRDARRPAAPVTAFLGAKLAGHTALGALLGTVGAGVQPGPHWRGAFLIGAAVVLLLFALDLAGVPRPSWTRRPGSRAGTPHACAPDRPQANERTTDRPHAADQCAPGGADTPADEPGKPDGAAYKQGGAADEPGGAGAGGGTRRWRRPVAAGAATLLVPCGLTLSAELLAVTSRSPVGGAAVMAGFVLGTVPVFAIAGLAAGRVLTMLRGRLTALLTAALVLVAGWTLLSGLRLGGWLPDGGTAAADTARFVRTDPSGVQVVTLWALTNGYRPALLTARAGVPTVLEVRTKNTHGHTRVLTIPARNRDVALPETGTTRVDLGVPGRGRMRFVCASGHYPGAVTFR